MSYVNSPLGKRSDYISHYAPELLFPISRQAKREEIGITHTLPFFGYDLWNAYEISWLNKKGKPIVATANIIVPAESSHIFESKSLKLYLNSLNQTHFNSTQEVENVIISDLSQATRSNVVVTLAPISNVSESFENLEGFCLDELDVEIKDYSPTPHVLAVDHKKQVTETLHSHLLKSNCLVTNQPDWGSIEIRYTGAQIDHASLLKYLVSLRNHNEFHEQCVEGIFMTILKRCKPSALTVYARYTRRGGLDINPFRSTDARFSIRNPRLLRQ